MSSQRFASPQDPLFQRLNSSIAFDFRLAPYDIEQSLAQSELSQLTHQHERDTLVYDVIRHRSEPRTYVVYARFTDEAAFEAHQKASFHDRLVPPILACLDKEMDLQFFDWLS